LNFNKLLAVRTLIWRAVCHRAGLLTNVCFSQALKYHRQVLVPGPIFFVAGHRTSQDRA